MDCTTQAAGRPRAGCRLLSPACCGIVLGAWGEDAVWEARLVSPRTAVGLNTTIHCGCGGCWWPPAAVLWQPPALSWGHTEQQQCWCVGEGAVVPTLCFEGPFLEQLDLDHHAGPFLGSRRMQAGEDDGAQRLQKGRT